MNENRQPVGRPRDTRVDQAVLDAARALLAEVGYAGLTMDAVAARAGVGKAAIYRRHATKQALVFAAAVHGVELEPPPDTGSLLGDLEALARVIVAHLGNPAAAPALMGLLAEAGADTSLGHALCSALIEVEREGNAAVLERAVRRGELARLPDIDLFHAMFGGTVLSWMLVVRLPTDELPRRLAEFMDKALRASH
ncbi:TetR/AcrR family transcriptional regulator [Yinghuangia seranimata]|uniref:TetR/AcrR family transcriptional regulator n=1 Tax=Yinghuangia seranimata TaxID=408067 RepID=UPI00248B2908|nr:TetR/AcrR family transcriptional regulator [Yinghuangia seranimata]MDI2124893.1 TetR/AcrR family transcriptional regulator [Yinghuangia seranimata]